MPPNMGLGAEHSTYRIYYLDTACGGLEPLVIVGDHQVHASQPAPGEGVLFGAGV